VLDHVLRFSLGKDKMERAAAAALADDLDRVGTPRGEVDTHAQTASHADGAMAVSAGAGTSDVFGQFKSLSLQAPEAESPTKVMNVYTGEMEFPKPAKK